MDKLVKALFYTALLVTVAACNNNVQLVSIYKNDGSLQCQSKHPETSLVDMQQELENRDIQVYHRSKSNDGLMRIQVCGSPTGNINVFSIESTDLSKAKQLGFIQVEKEEGKL